ncbi:hypothetical protein niasHS_011382 [Heterodera schachtii]|uniref:B30.2/SPRY domain-containing protein n=1 Tax=Heterodera schachtii TaxID=97005 RepID=A0ABD2INT1_HETSC
MPKRNSHLISSSSISFYVGANGSGQTEGSPGPSAEKFAKIKLENRILKAELKQREMMDELNALKKKVAEMEQQKETEKGKYVSIDQFKKLKEDQQKAILEEIGKMEKRQKQQREKVTNALAGQIKQLKDDQNKCLERTIGLEKEQAKAKGKYVSADHFEQMQNDQKKALLGKIVTTKKKNDQFKTLLNFRQNYFDGTACHNDLEITDGQCLTIQYKEKSNNYGYRSVFAKHSILLNNDFSTIFYFEILITNLKSFSVFFGFAHKQQSPLDKRICNRIGTYAYESDGWIWINGSGKGANAEYSYVVGDTVGIGVNLATRKIIFTKNGQQMDSSYLLVDSSHSSAASLFPFVYLWSFGDKILANFGPNFKFDLTTF